jgi:hypothetical protein
MRVYSLRREGVHEKNKALVSSDHIFKNN